MKTHLEKSKVHRCYRKQERQPLQSNSPNSTVTVNSTVKCEPRLTKLNSRKSNEKITSPAFAHSGFGSMCHANEEGLVCYPSKRPRTQTARCGGTGPHGSAEGVLPGAMADPLRKPCSTETVTKRCLPCSHGTTFSPGELQITYMPKRGLVKKKKTKNRAHALDRQTTKTHRQNQFYVM